VNLDKNNHAVEKNGLSDRYKQMLSIGVFAALLIVIYLAWSIWWTKVGSLSESTKNAYVEGYHVAITSEINGRIASLNILEMQRVEAGQLLLSLDDADTEIALALAEAALREAVRNSKQQNFNASYDQVQVEISKLRRKLAELNLTRREPLLGKSVTQEQIDQSRVDLELAEAEHRAAKLRSMSSQVYAGHEDIKASPAVLAARAKVIEAWLAHQRTRIYAPIAGDVVMMSAQPGQGVIANTPLLQIIPQNTMWIEANFKESQLAILRVGQPVEVIADIYGDEHIYTGHISGFSAGTGAVFSLLPPQNAVGNWVKVVQRLPVRIDLDPEQLQAYPLKIGLSAAVKVDTSNRNGSPLGSAVHGPDLREASRWSLLEGQAVADKIIAEELAR
jgi:membrane fusion protein (multidrug efflux system)